MRFERCVCFYWYSRLAATEKSRNNFELVNEEFELNAMDVFESELAAATNPATGYLLGAVAMVIDRDGERRTKKHHVVHGANVRI